MSGDEARPFRLFNSVQHYEWGTKNADAFIPKFLGIPAVPGLPYGELWIGAHPKTSSAIEFQGKKQPLDKVIEEHPIEFLGEVVARKFDRKFPFLLKVLSASKALSIQTHPNKEQAKRLHASDPRNYPDNNHKPEIAIAIDELTAIVGFRPVEEIVVNLRNCPELGEFAGKQTVDRINGAKGDSELRERVKELYAAVMNHAGDVRELETVISSIVKRLKKKENHSPEESHFLDQHRLYGADVGLFSFLFFNIVRLKPGQAIFTDAGVPHAYIQGTIVECMANSDNVVRAGLTNKFKDVPTLLEILRYDFARCPIINEVQKYDGVIYRTTAEEFEVSGYSKTSTFEMELKTENKPSVVLVTGGNVNVQWNAKGERRSEQFSKGESFLIPAMLSECMISSKGNTAFFLVSIP